ncbi:MAG: ATP-binding cassette domain-containing protein [Burkholderiales bacterium]|nr:ATP-binding cassette domain-containing protein [Burkholderiales bacterium]
MTSTSRTRQAQGFVDLDLARKGGFELKARFEFPEEGITVIFGESGSGKTTVLRCVAGLERGNGVVRIGDQYWQDDARGIFLPTWQRPLGYVFQEASLFPHLTARKNIEFAVKRSTGLNNWYSFIPGVDWVSALFQRIPMKKDSQTKSAGGDLKNARQRMESAIDLLGIRDLLSRKPAQLSGGERQRVAIARAVSTAPAIMLFDEPLAALDFARKAEILPWLEKLKEELRIPMLYVTHSAEEVMRLADNLVVLHKGNMLASGPVEEVLASVKVPIALGGDTGVLIKGEVVAVDHEWKMLTFSNGKISLTFPDSGHKVGDHINIRILAKDVSLTTQETKGTSILNNLESQVTEIAPETNGFDSLVQVSANGQPLIAKITNKSVHNLKLEVGTKVWVAFKAAAVLVA